MRGISGVAFHLQIDVRGEPRGKGNDSRDSGRPLMTELFVACIARAYVLYGHFYSFVCSRRRLYEADSFEILIN